MNSIVFLSHGEESEQNNHLLFLLKQVNCNKGVSMVEIDIQLNVCGSYHTENTSITKIIEAVRKALEGLATCDMIDLPSWNKTCDDEKLPRKEKLALEAAEEGS